MTFVRVTDPDPDAFLDQLACELDQEATATAAEGLVQLSEALPELTPSPALRERILDGARSEGRLARFAAGVAELLDVGIDKAKALLERIDDPAAWSLELPGIAFLWVDGGPRVASAVRGFVRIQAGVAFPDHEHLGEEVVLVLQGGFEDAARGLIFRPGDVDRMPAGSSHAYRALADGPDLLKLAVVQTGLRALGQEYLPR